MNRAWTWIVAGLLGAGCNGASAGPTAQQQADLPTWTLESAMNDPTSVAEAIVSEKDVFAGDPEPFSKAALDNRIALVEVGLPPETPMTVEHASSIRGCFNTGCNNARWQLVWDQRLCDRRTNPTLCLHSLIGALFNDQNERCNWLHVSARQDVAPHRQVPNGEVVSQTHVPQSNTYGYGNHPVYSNNTNNWIGFSADNPSFPGITSLTCNGDEGYVIEAEAEFWDGSGGADPNLHIPWYVGGFCC